MEDTNGGTPAKKKSMSGKEVALIAVAVIVVGGWWLNRIGQEVRATNAVQTSAQPTAPEQATQATEAPAPVEHGYVHSEGGEYGYEQALSPDDVQQGVAQKPLVMVRYFGSPKEGTHQFDLRMDDGGARTVVVCSDDCSVAKITAFVGSEHGPTQTVKLSPTSLIGVVARDIREGLLEKYPDTADGAKPSKQHK